MSKFLMFSFLFTLIFLNVFAQEENGYVDIKGTVKFDRINVSGAKVILFEGTKQISSAITGISGRFNFKLDFQKNYTIEVSAPELVTKRISIDTKIPTTEYGVWPYRFTTDLFEDFPGLDLTALKNPVTKIRYNADEEDFDSDAAYTELMKKEIDKILKQLETVRTDLYKNTIIKADKLFADKNYEEAIKAYEEAFDIDSYQDYPDEMLYEISKLISKEKSGEISYNNAISKADSYMLMKNYKTARTYYDKSLSYKPDESYPIGKIAEIDKLLAEAEKVDIESEKLEKEYEAIINKADVAYRGKKYEEAKTNYSQALKLRPDDWYPKDMIKEIDELLAENSQTIAAAKAKDDSYKAAISKADGLLASKKYADAKSAYSEASNIKSEESYPKTKITEIDKTLADIAKADADAKAKADADAKALADAKAKEAAAAKAKDDSYKAAISKADGLLASKKYTDAKSAYSEASNIKSEESYPKTKISEIDKTLADIAKADADAKAKETAETKVKEFEDKYNNAIRVADEFFTAYNYDEAEKKYNEALSLKPNEQYPKNKIIEIKNQIAALQKKQEESDAKNKQYEDAVTKGDSYFNAGQYVSANASYTHAISLKSTASYPKQQIAKIKEIQKQQEATDIAQADAEKAQKLKEAQESVQKLKELEEVDLSNEEVKKKYLSELAQKYPEGITTENHTGQGKTIKRIIVNRNGIANEFREVKHSWGGIYYFKNGQSIVQSSFYLETKE